ncbi:hypothetical protein ACHAWF_008472 [Thalassiosira exigua]
MSDNRSVTQATQQAVTTDEIKKKKLMGKKMQQLVKGGTNLLKFIEMHPDIWGKPLMSEFRELSYKITGDPKTFKPQDKGGWGAETNALTKDIGASLFAQTVPDLSGGSNVILQITHSESEWVKRTIDNSTVLWQRWKFTAVDGDGTSILLRVDSTLSSAANLLTPGSIVNIQSFIPIRYSYDDHNDKRCAIVIKEFELKGYQPLKEEQMKRPTKRAKAKKVKSTRKQPTKTPESPQCKCKGEQCSQHGVEFVLCITECVPVNSVSLPLVARECVFADKELSAMSQSEKRFLLYYYYATTVYQFRGKNNRVELPECLKAAIRALYPNNVAIETNRD